MNEMIEWLRAQLDTDEQKALLAKAEIEAASKTWQGFADDIWKRALIDADGVADHLEANDPERVLRQVQAHRAILKAAFGHMAKVDGEWGCCHSADAIERGQCPEQEPADDEIVKALVSIYSDRDGYKEEWSA